VNVGIIRAAATHARIGISVRLEDDTARTLHEATLPAWRPGDRVRIVERRLQSNAWYFQAGTRALGPRFRFCGVLEAIGAG